MDSDEVIPSPHERMTYLVRSESNPKTRYRVDLLANDGASECSCEDWAKRRGPALRNGSPMGTPATLCKHCKAAREYFLNGLLQRLSEELENA